MNNPETDVAVVAEGREICLLKHCHEVETRRLGHSLFSESLHLSSTLDVDTLLLERGKTMTIVLRIEDGRDVNLGNTFYVLGKFAEQAKILGDEESEKFANLLGCIWMGDEEIPVDEFKLIQKQAKELLEGPYKVTDEMKEMLVDIINA